MIKEKKASTVLQSLKVCNFIAMSAIEKVSAMVRQSPYSVTALLQLKHHERHSKCLSSVRDWLVIFCEFDLALFPHMPCLFLLHIAFPLSLPLFIYRLLFPPLLLLFSI